MNSGSTYDTSLREFTQRQDGLIGTNTAILMQALRSTHKLLITQDIGPPLEVTVAQFEPGPGDPLSYKWKDAHGKRRRFGMPPYYISDMVTADRDMVLYCNRSYHTYIEKLLVASNSIVWRTFAFACNQTAAKSVSVIQCFYPNLKTLRTKAADPLC